MVQAPGDASKWYIVEKRGVVRVVDNVANPTSAATFVDLQDRVNAEAYESGLLGMAFDPNYATNRRVYLSYTADPTVAGAVFESRISRFIVSGGVIDPASEVKLLTIAQPFANHNGGQIAFGPDGMLYAGFGDGGSGGDPQNNAQNRSNLLGKVLRLDVSAGGPYVIPPDNPFAGAGSARCETGVSPGGELCGEIYAYGLRNPWRWSFDRAAATPDMWLGDVGQGEWEEVDRIRPGGNYGWRFREGAHCYSPSANCPTTADGVPLIDPVAEYSHSVGNSITGGYVYRGSAIASLVGRYVFADFGAGDIFVLVPNASGVLERQLLLNTNEAISSFAEGHDGELYFTDLDGGELFKLVPATGAPPASTVPSLLSQTGCVDPANPTQPAAGLIPYAPVAPFWSDGADKLRWMALPDGQRITVAADGDWSFPAGTVLMKNFMLNGALIETRLFMRHTDTGNWAGYTYRWDDAQSDATLVSGGLVAEVGPAGARQLWTYPGESECLQCHTSAAGGSLGLETRQLNSTITYPATGRTANQLTTLESIGLFSAALPVQPAYVDPNDPSQPLAERARTYLHTNCSHCHRPGGTTQANLDLRYATAIGSTNACNVPPQKGNMGVADARILAPGDPARSVLWLRMTRRDAQGMPPLGSHIVDSGGATLIQQWISGMNAACE